MPSSRALMTARVNVTLCWLMLTVSGPGALNVLPISGGSAGADSADTDGAAEAAIVATEATCCSSFFSLAGSDPQPRASDVISANDSGFGDHKSATPPRPFARRQCKRRGFGPVTT